MLRRTKIIATLGPATDDENMVDRIIEAGVDVVRINFSYDPFEVHRRRVNQIRDRASAHGRTVGVIVDLQGPKIRIECFRDGEVTLYEGANFILDPHHDPANGDENCVGTAYENLHNDVSRGDTLLLDDGRIVLWVDKVVKTRIECKVVVGGVLSDHKGINKQGGGLSAPSLTPKDRKQIKSAAKLEADYVAVSFTKTGDDVRQARELLREAGGNGGIIAKIERTEALEAIDDIIAASDAIMVARGDLGVEIGDANLPPVQKDLIRNSREKNCVVITATQMMESMKTSHVPTRAEVFDVANAVLDGTDAVMLSAETAVGVHPDKVIESMDRICREAEKQRLARVSDHRIDTTFERIDEAIAMATMYTANHLGVSAIAAMTESGSTALWMSRISSGIPIFALTRHVDTRRKVTLYRGVYPVNFDVTTADPLLANNEIIDELRRHGSVRNGDRIIITKGELSGVAGGTNNMKIVCVGEN